MASTLRAGSIRAHLGVGQLSILEIAVLAPLAAFVVMWTIPAAFDVEWACVGGSGALRTGGDAYAAAFGVAGTFGWLVVGLAVLFANIAESRRVALLLPLAWFVLLVVTALVAAAGTGPSICT